MPEINGIEIINRPIHCVSIQDTRDLFRLLKEHNITWITGRTLDPLQTQWLEREQICYRYDPTFGGIAKSSYNWYKNSEYKDDILEFEDLITPPEEIKPTEVLPQEEKRKLLREMI